VVPWREWLTTELDVKCYVTFFVFPHEDCPTDQSIIGKPE
jgi:hypothetical protein